MPLSFVENEANVLFFVSFYKVRYCTVLGWIWNFNKSGVYLSFLFRAAVLRVRTRVKVTSFTSADIEHLKEYAQVMTPVAMALDKLQGEDLAYLGCLLPTLAVSIIRLKAAQENNLMYCTVTHQLQWRTEASEWAAKAACSHHPTARLGHS